MATVRGFISVLLLAAAVSGFLSAKGKSEPAPKQAEGAMPEEGGYYVARTDGDLRIYQIITFPAVPHTLRYEVEIEQLGGREFVPLERINTEINRVELNLRAGLYRYRVTAYNKMGLLEGVSAWQEFRINAALPPEAESYQPFYGLYYELADPSGRITLTGANFSDSSEFALVPHRNFDWSGISLEDRNDVLYPEQVTVDSTPQADRAILDFNRKHLRRGEYDIFIRNPGGLWTVWGRVRVGFRKNTDWTLSFGWSPMIAAFDYTQDTYFHYTANSGEERQRLNRFNPRGAYLRLGWLPVKTRIGNFGLELSTRFLTDNERSDDDSYKGFMSNFNSASFGLLYQYSITDQWQIELRAGAGFGQTYMSDYEIEPYNAGFSVDFGAGVQYFIWKNLYAQVGLDFQYQQVIEHLMIWPALGLGWQFGRWGEMSMVTRALDRGEDPSVPVANIPKSEFTLSFGWSPMIPLGMDYKTVDSYDYLSGIPTSETTLLQPVTPWGAYFRAAYIPHRWGRNRLGAELQVYILDHPNREEWTGGEDVYRVINIFSHFHVGALYQRILTENLQLNARLGGGISNPYEFGKEISYYNYGYGAGYYQMHSYGVEIPFSMDAGISAQYFFWKGFYAEAGLDLFVSLGRETHWMLHPGIGIGWQFNKSAETGYRGALRAEGPQARDPAP